jgi:hypothetical protein
VPPINRASSVSDEDTAGLAGSTDDVPPPIVCAIAAGLPSRVSNAAVVIRLRIIGSPEISMSLFLFHFSARVRGHENENLRLPSDVVAAQNANKRNMEP